MRELTVNEIEEVNGGRAKVLKEIAKVIVGGAFYDALKGAFKGPRKAQTKGQMGRKKKK